MPIIRTGFAILCFLTTLYGVAEARHHGHGRAAGNAQDTSSESRNPGPVGAMMAQFILACGLQVAELKSFPIDAIAQSTAPDEAQNNALQKARRVAGDAAVTLAAGCPKEVPSDPSARLDSMEHGVDAVEAALNALQPPLQVFYTTLRSDQKARLETRFTATPLAFVTETTGISSRAATRRSRRHGGNSDDGPESASAAAAPAKEWDCAQWEAELRAWPLMREEQQMMIGPRQRAAFYEFAAAFQHAADKLADTCPAEVAATPIGRIGELLKKLEAVRQSAITIRPALGRFYRVLDAEQKSHFDSAI